MDFVFGARNEADQFLTQGFQLRGVQNCSEGPDAVA